MAVRNVPQRAGRIRGHEAPLSSRAAKFLVEEMHRAPARKGKPASLREKTATAMARVRNEGAQTKPPQSGGEGRTLRVQSPSTLRRNRSNVKRKPEARRKSPFKKLMRKQTISAPLRRMMATEPGKGDRPRTAAQRRVRQVINRSAGV
jgi:hypothetical protein